MKSFYQFSYVENSKFFIIPQSHPLTILLNVNVMHIIYNTKQSSSSSSRCFQVQQVFLCKHVFLLTHSFVDVFRKEENEE